MNQVSRIIELIKGYKSDIDENIAKLDIETMIDKVRLYCNISELPSTLERPIARELYRIYNTTGEGISSLTEGDTSIKYATTIDFDNAMKNLQPTLFAYRRLYTAPKEVVVDE